ncbi:ATP-binding cassette domain-containing protein [Frankia sp. CiP3]|uniref:ATP-binding cassette domain-containing protein n=1 Tax=Frankia sp. CiP3 TaxID=2880971 RepID=UPI001EF71074|nr:ATP-binding cassette domain-containing protein [Frankia sp. CiP3]
MSTPLKIVSSTGEVIITGDRPFVVGRGKGSDLVLIDRQVSRRHVVITRTDTEWTAQDVSSYGTWVDGQRVKQVAVQGEIRLRLGAPDGPELAVLPVLPDIPLLPDVPLSPDIPSITEPPRFNPRSEMSTVWRSSPEYERDRQTTATGPDGAARLEREHGRRNTYPLRRGTMSIGRSNDNDIVVADLLASRRHAEIFVGQSGVHVVDLDSANGTFLNGRKISREAVAQRDIIAVGHHLFQLEGETLVEYLDSGDVTFEADGLNVFVKDMQIMHDVSFRLPGRALLAVIGPSGSGKSTLLNALTGFRPADKGAVRYAGRDMYAEYGELRRRIGHVPQDDLLHTTLTVRKALEYGARLRFPPDTTKEERRERVDEVLHELGLQERADVPVRNLSGGQRKRTSVALELLTRPTLLFLDEPTSGLDPGMDQNVMGALRTLADDGRTIVVVTHSVAQLDICDYILVLAKGGRTAYFGPPGNALTFLEKDSWPDVFQMLESAVPTELADRFRHSEYFVPASVTAPPARPTPAALPSARQQSVFSQIATLSRRQLSVIASDRSYLWLIAAFPFLLGILPRVGPAPHRLDPLPNGIPNVDAQMLLIVVVLCACFMGMANSIREIVKEKAIYRRERAIGLSITAYLGSKIVVLVIITALQSIVFAIIGMTNRTPRQAVVLSSPMLEVILAVAMISISSAMLGLAISAWVDNADKTMPLLVMTTMSQVVFSGGLVPLEGKLGLQQIGYLMPARWGYAAIASSADLNDVVKLGNVPFSRGPVDPLWVHAAHIYLTDIVAGFAVGCLAVAACALLLRRLDPKAGTRRGKLTSGRKTS